jgi:hypothetical protein
MVYTETARFTDLVIHLYVFYKTCIALSVDEKCYRSLVGK